MRIIIFLFLFLCSAFSAGSYGSYWYEDRPDVNPTNYCEKVSNIPPCTLDDVTQCPRYFVSPITCFENGAPFSTSVLGTWFSSLDDNLTSRDFSSVISYYQSHSNLPFFSFTDPNLNIDIEYDPYTDTYKNLSNPDTNIIRLSDGSYLVTPICADNEILSNNECICRYGQSSSGSCLPVPEDCSKYKAVNPKPDEYVAYNQFTNFDQCLQFLNSEGINGSWVSASVPDSSSCSPPYTCFAAFVSDPPPPIVDYNSSSDVDYSSSSNNDYNATGFISDNNSSNIDNTNYLGQKIDNLGSLSSSFNNKIDNLGVIASSSNSKLSSIDISLKAIRDKSDLTNNNLKSLKTTNLNGFNLLGTKVDDLKKEVSGGNFTGDLGFDGITDFYNNVQTDLDSITDQYNNYTSIYQNGFSSSDFNMPSGQNPIFTTQVFGKTLTFDLCNSFSIFKPILYLLFSFIFLLLAVRLMWLGIKFNLGSN